jgi:hypothetical protein
LAYFKNHIGINRYPTCKPPNDTQAAIVCGCNNATLNIFFLVRLKIIPEKFAFKLRVNNKSNAVRAHCRNRFSNIKKCELCNFLT